MNRKKNSEQLKSEHVSILGAFGKLQKVTISFVRSIRPSVRPSVRPPARPPAQNNSAPTRRIFIKFDMSIFRK